MIRKTLTTAAAALFIIGISCSVGCTEPGPVVKGEATNNDFAEVTDQDTQGYTLSKGVGIAN